MPINRRTVRFDVQHAIGGQYPLVTLNTRVSTVGAVNQTSPSCAIDAGHNRIRHNIVGEDIEGIDTAFDYRSRIVRIVD